MPALAPPRRPPRFDPGPFQRKSLHDWLLRVAAGDKRTLETVYKTAMSMGASGQTGGYLVPQQFAEPILKTIAERPVLFKAGIERVDMDTSDVLLPYPDPTFNAPAGVSDFFGGIQFRWSLEVSTRFESEPTFRQLSLHANELSGYIKMSNPVADDSPNIDTWLQKLIADAIAWQIDFAFFQGTGVAQPLGVLNTPALLSVSGRATGAIVIAALQAMVKVLLPGSWETACFFCHPTVLSDLAGIAQYFINTSPDSGGPFGWLLNRPLYVTEKLPARGTTGDILLVDVAKYVAGVRKELQIDVSKDETNSYLNNQQVWRVIARADGQPLLSTTVKTQDGTTVSPFIAVT